MWKNLDLKRIAIGTLAVVVGLPILAWAVQPWPISVRWKNPETTAYMDYRAASARDAGEPFEIRQQWVPLDHISPELIRAVTAAEDDRFMEHRGVDWKAVAEEVRYAGGLPPNILSSGDRRALRDAWAYARENWSQVRGRSTITQQVARNLYLSPDRQLLRKGRELIIARRLERFLQKERILEIYLNVAELGPGIFGVEAAARTYFGRSAADLSPAQAAALAATLPHPLTSNPARNPARMEWRRDRILAYLGGGTEPVPPPILDVLDPLPSDLVAPLAPEDFLEPVELLPPPPLPPPAPEPPPAASPAPSTEPPPPPLPDSIR